MSSNTSISNILGINDNNIKIIENSYKEIIKYKKNGIKIKTCSVDAVLIQPVSFCPRCGCIFNDNQTYEKNGFTKSTILITNSNDKPIYLNIKKQRYLCHSCNKKFISTSNIINKNCFISNNIKLYIAKLLTKKISEKDIATLSFTSPNTVERIIDSYYENNKLYKHYLPEVLSFDEFKSVKDADGAMSFHMVNGLNGQTIDIVEDRKLTSLLKYFSYYTRKARLNVKFITIDMYSPYISLIKTMFPNAQIVIDKFHIVELISRSLNKTRIELMKKDKKNYNKLKRYWKSLLKRRDELDYSKWQKWTCFDNLMTQSDIVNYLINLSPTLKETYEVYQNLLEAINNKDFNLFNSIINGTYNNLSNYMITSLKTLREYAIYIKNTFETGFHNGFVEGNNNFIKVIKRIAFGFKSFRRFKARIMICKGIMKIKRSYASA